MKQHLNDLSEILSLGFHLRLQIKEFDSDSFWEMVDLVIGLNRQVKVH